MLVRGLLRVGIFVFREIVVGFGPLRWASLFITDAFFVPLSWAPLFITFCLLRAPRWAPLFITRGLLSGNFIQEYVICTLHET